jgi:hypothetical protein
MASSLQLNNVKEFNMKKITLLVLILNAAFVSASTHWGRNVSVGNGQAKTFIEVNGKNVKTIGVALSPGALTNLGQHHMQEYLLPLPTAINVHPHKYVGMDWNPHGHEPMNIYTKPHFDFHFYFISNALRQAITCTGEDAQSCLESPTENFIPSQYGPTPSGVPKMGWHWVDLLAPEFNGGEFTRTFIYGYYKGTMIFLEPMVTLEYLKSKIESLNNVRRPETYPYKNGAFPGKYRVYFDAKDNYHKVVLEDLSN